MVVPPIVSDSNFTNSNLFDASVNAGVIQLKNEPNFEETRCSLSVSQELDFLFVGNDVDCFLGCA